MKTKPKKLAVSAKAARILRKVAAHILEEPRRLEMSQWMENVSPASSEAPPCGTQGCIAGWTCFLVRGEKNFVDADIEARKLLGITKTAAAKLFYFKGWQEIGVGWPVRFSREYNEAEKPEGRAQAAAARIEFFIRTGK